MTEYLQERSLREGLTGEEAADLKADLRSHIHEEAERSEGETIGLMHLENILGRLDAGYRPIMERLLKTAAPRAVIQALAGVDLRSGDAAGGVDI